MLTVALFGIRQVIRSNAELRAARDEIATLAVAEERARLARDLHDVLGHSLTTITVKAGLARRILESSGDAPAGAVAELRDVEHLSRTALAEVRSTVSGYRKASLAAELVGARAALAAAEIEADLPHAVDNVPCRAAGAVRLRAAGGRHERDPPLRRAAAARCGSASRGSRSATTVSDRTVRRVPGTASPGSPSAWRRSAGPSTPARARRAVSVCARRFPLRCRRCPR